MRALSLLALLTLTLAGCRDLDLIEPSPISEPSFYNAGGSYWLVTTVVDTDDHTCDADCSLRDAVYAASSGDEIRFGVSGTITLAATVQINKNLTITGPGATQLTVSGDKAYRVFTFGAGVTASLSGLTVADGSADYGGGIYFRSTGTLTITDCVISDNHATASGGGIYNQIGTLTVTGSIISANSAAAGGGIVNYSGGIVSITESTISGNTATTGGAYRSFASTLILERSTVSGNTAAGSGGGLWFQGGSTSTILNSTISGNTAGGTGGGIYRFHGITRIILSTITDNEAATGSGGVDVYYAEPRVDVKGSIIWGNTRSGATPIADDVGGSAGAYYSMGYNLIGAGIGIVSFNEDSDQTEVTDPLLGTLQLNAPGTTETHALLAGSPAIDAGTCMDDAVLPVLTDQRGVTRPQPSGGACDIGAYERWGGNLSPDEAAQLLVEEVEALGPDGAGTLNKGQTNSLLVILDLALNKLANGQSHVALNNLGAFIDKVETFTADGVLATPEGQRLIDAAQQIIAGID